VSPIELIRVRGQVQGVGFRPSVARLARQLGLSGWVKNDAEGVLIALAGSCALRDRFVSQLPAELPRLARIDELTRTPASHALTGALPKSTDGTFSILHSQVEACSGQPSASIAPDAAPCSACCAEILDPSSRRYRYAFTTCTQCGPRFSIALGLPWDRVRTTLATFELCPSCQAEYADIRDRRYHAEPIACPSCGPQLQLLPARAPHTLAHGGIPRAPSDHCDELDLSAQLLCAGEIVALKGIGGFHLSVDATNPLAVARLRHGKQRADKPFALLARDLDMVERYCELTPSERTALSEPSAPIVLLRPRATPCGPRLADNVASLPLSAAGQLGFMLPSSPLHVLLMERMSHPLVCTSGNLGSQPPVLDDGDARSQLGDIAAAVLGHNRPIQRRVDDSVVRVFGGRVRVLRRARGLAPAPLPLPPGFEDIAAHETVLAAGADLKAALCLSRRTDFVLSQHLGDLDDARSFVQYREHIADMCGLFAQRPTRVVTDNHPDSRAAQCARTVAEQLGVPSEHVGHHHAHFAACLGEHRVARGAQAMLGLVLDGVGAGDTGDRPLALWGAEVLVGGYAHAQRSGTLKPVALLGGDRAAREPWRCLYAQLRAALTETELSTACAHTPTLARLRSKPLALLDHMLATGLGAPLASSCGRLFDAVAAALGACFEGQSYEGQAAITLEALATHEHMARAAAAHEPRYPLHVCDVHGLLVLDPSDLWRALLTDLAGGVELGLISARFHVALAAGFAALCEQVLEQCERSSRPVQRVVALSGGCLQNAWLHGRLEAELAARGFRVLSHAAIPPNDGGIALGQALVSLAKRAAEMES